MVKGSQFENFLEASKMIGPTLASAATLILSQVQLKSLPLPLTPIFLSSILPFNFQSTSNH